jgi:SPP1 family predicted phage head-tail adaptor
MQLPEPGRLNQRITIQRRGQTTNALNEQVDAWTDVCKVWAEVLPVRGKEYFAAEKLENSTQYKVRIYHRADVNNNMRIVWPAMNMTMDITDCLPLGGVRGLMEIMCATGVRDAL